MDEWGAWYKPGSEVHNSHLLGQQATIRDAVLAGLTLDIFHRHADKVAMANIAQLVNCLQSLFLAHEDKFILTPTYHVFDMYAAHQGGQSLRTNVSASPLKYTSNGKPATMRGLNGSASLHDRRAGSDRHQSRSEGVRRDGGHHIRRERQRSRRDDFDGQGHSRAQQLRQSARRRAANVAGGGRKAARWFTISRPLR